MAVVEDSRQSSPQCSNSRQKERAEMYYGGYGCRDCRVGLRAVGEKSVGGMEAPLVVALSHAPPEEVVGERMSDERARDVLRYRVVEMRAVHEKPSQRDQCRLRQSQTSSPPRR